MEKRETDLLSHLAPLIAQNKLFIASFRRGAFNLWMQFFHLYNDKTEIIDVILFDPAEEFDHHEIKSSEKLYRVLSLDFKDWVPRERRRAIVRAEVAGEVIERRISFADMLFHVLVAPVHRSGESPKSKDGH